MNNFHKYDKELDIHFIDFTYEISLDTGTTRIQELEKRLNKSSNSGSPIKILLNTKGYEKNHPEIHDNLAKLAREKFKDRVLYTAVLNDQYSFKISENECWFTDNDDAIKWLIQYK